MFLEPQLSLYPLLFLKLLGSFIHVCLSPLGSSLLGKDTLFIEVFYCNELNILFNPACPNDTLETSILDDVSGSFTVFVNSLNSKTNAK